MINKIIGYLENKRKNREWTRVTRIIDRIIEENTGLNEFGIEFTALNLISKQDLSNYITTQHELQIVNIRGGDLPAYTKSEEPSAHYRYNVKKTTSFIYIPT